MYAGASGGEAAVRSDDDKGFRSQRSQRSQRYRGGAEAGGGDESRQRLGLSFGGVEGMEESSKGIGSNGSNGLKKAPPAAPAAYQQTLISEAIEV